MKSSHLLVVILVVILSCFGLLISCGSDDVDVNIEGTACTLDNDCQKTDYMCDIDNTCTKCTYCEARTDCPNSNMTCNTDTNCCKQVLCTTNEECEDALFCREFVCREMSCSSDSDCAKFESDTSSFCKANVCTKKECTSYSDCDSNFCDEENYVCKDCLSDTDCPENFPVCSGGTCKEKAIVDGDSIGDKEGCTEFANSCLYDTLSCFDKIYPQGQEWASCEKDTDSNDLSGYVFTFSDGARWSTYGNPASYHIAKGADGCYYKVSLKIGYFEYTDKGGNMLGRLLYDKAEDLVQITCPNGSVEYYSYEELGAGSCDGYPDGIIYSGTTLGCLDSSK